MNRAASLITGVAVFATLAVAGLSPAVRNI